MCRGVFIKYAMMAGQFKIRPEWQVRPQSFDPARQP